MKNSKNNYSNRNKWNLSKKIKKMNKKYKQINKKQLNNNKIV